MPRTTRTHDRLDCHTTTLITQSRSELVLPLPWKSKVHHRIIPRIGSSSRGRQVQVVPPCLSCAIDIFSQKYYCDRVYPNVVAEALQRSLPVNDISLIRDVTNHVWTNKVPEIKADVADCVEKERELIQAFKNSTLKISDLTKDGKIAYVVIDSLYREFGNMFKNVVEFLGWGVVIITGGLDPCMGRIRTVGYNYGCTAANGKDFISSFNDAAKAGYIPSTNEVGRNGPPLTTQQKEYIESPVDVDPATLITKDSEDLIQAPIEVSAPVPLPPVFSSVPTDGTPSTSVPSYSIPSHPLPSTALTPPLVSSPSPPTTTPHPQGTVFISPQPDTLEAFYRLLWMPAIETTNHPNPQTLITVILTAFFSTAGILLLLALCIIAYDTSWIEEEEEVHAAFPFHYIPNHHLVPQPSLTLLPEARIRA
ncbi:hypothetical protein ARMGADRAFT_1075152 [Armillaria gallica]|uniref:Uncharacterized protein n=1 Tax=Armillaria gallica TaxID=47427 RepID=A0A2H3DSU5_ARMGA|nr:hypothetical protein ARMGADRAFT_1075152 [Armillaria gallica]